MSNSNEIDKQTLNEFLQCYVSTAFLGLAEPWRYKVKSYKNPPPANNWLYGSTIIPIKSKHPKYFINYCQMNPDFKDFFQLGTSESKTNKFKHSLSYEIYLVKDMDPFDVNTHKTKEILLNFGESEEFEADSVIYEWTERDEQRLQNAERIPPSKRTAAEDAALNKLKTLKADAGLSTGGAAGGRKKTTYVKRDAIKVTFDGTNPSTARKDVKVDLTFTMTSFNNLNSIVGEYYNEDKGTWEKVKLYELITHPYGVEKTSPGLGGKMVNQYSPDYNRLRIKIIVDGDSVTDRIDDLIIDLAIIDHSISRNNDTGFTELKIHYRGYFESILSMPWMDALADAAELDQRIEDEKLLKKALEEKCEPSVIKEMVKMNRKGDSIQAKHDGWNNVIQQLFNNGDIFKYEVPEADLKSYVETGDLNTVIAQQNAQAGGVAGRLGMSMYNNPIINATAMVTSAGGTPLFSSTDPIMTDLEAISRIMVEDQTTDLSAISATAVGSLFPSIVPGTINTTHVEGAFFFLGDLFRAVTKKLYKQTARQRDTPKDYFQEDLTFVFSDMEVANPFFPNEQLKFQPTCMPIDLYYFKNWWQKNVIDKDVTYFSSMNMIRVILERLINDLLYETCYGNNMQDEIPPVMRTSFFTDTRNNPYQIWKPLKKNTSGNGLADDECFVEIDGTGDGPAQGKLFHNDAHSNLTISHYCVIHMGLYNRVIPYSPSKFAYNNKYIPTLTYGINDSKSFISDISFTKTNAPGLREARYFNSFNSLAILANVYDAKITLKSAGATTMLYPGTIINLTISDFALPDRNPHVLNSLSNNMGIGGYYIIKKVTYDLGTNPQNYTIILETKWIGTNAMPRLRRTTTTGKIQTKHQKCETIYNEAKDRVQVIAATAGEEIQLSEIERVTATPATATTAATSAGTRVPEGGAVTVGAGSAQDAINRSEAKGIIMDGTVMGGGSGSFGQRMAAEVKAKISSLGYTDSQYYVPVKWSGEVHRVTVDWKVMTGAGAGQYCQITGFTVNFKDGRSVDLSSDLKSTGGTVLDPGFKYLDINSGDFLERVD